MTDLSTPPRRLVLPPPYRQRWNAAGWAFDTAVGLAAQEGAGTLVWGMPAGHLDLAVVLEPEMPLPDARMAHIVGAVALSEALAAHCPPERAVRIGWPDEVIHDGARLGGIRFAVAPGTRAGAVPDWMVFGAELLAHRDAIAAPGLYPGSISLREEEFGDPAQIVESFAAHLMLWFDRWMHQGAAVVTERFRVRSALERPLPDGPLHQASAGATFGLWRGVDGVRL